MSKKEFMSKKEIIEREGLSVVKKVKTEPCRTFKIKKFGTSYMVILDRELRDLLNIRPEEVEKGIVGLRVDNLRKVRFYKNIDEFIDEEKYNGKRK